jgi:riboflavin kinase/FMN adenylyltransferase
MKILENLQEINFKGSAVSIGYFDGVHKGHVALLNRLVSQAKERGLESVVVTFSIHPREALNANYVPKLITLNEERYRLLEEQGIDYCVVLPFDKEISGKSFKQFMDSYLIDKLNTKYLLIGHDHHFGCDRANGFEQYKQYGEEKGIVVEREEVFKIKDIVVSSSHARRQIQEGNVVGAKEALGYDYFIEGTVIPGFKLGKSIGFPTANVAVNDVRKLLPAAGVYAVTVNVEGNSKPLKSMLYIGARPTFVDMSETKSIEVHIFDFNEDIYQKRIRVNFKQFIREEQKFDSPSKLATQLNKDKQVILEWFAKKKI